MSTLKLQVQPEQCAGDARHLSHYYTQPCSRSVVTATEGRELADGAVGLSRRSQNVLDDANQEGAQEAQRRGQKAETVATIHGAAPIGPGKLRGG